MSSNNSLVILKKEGKFHIYSHDCVDNTFYAGKGNLLNTRKTLPEALKFANKYQSLNLVEYGIHIDKSCYEEKAKDKDLIKKDLNLK